MLFGYGLAGIYYFEKQNLVLSMAALYLHIALILKSFQHGFRKWVLAS
jgi:hypothetical protein